MARTKPANLSQRLSAARAFEHEKSEILNLADRLIGEGRYEAAMAALDCTAGDAAQLTRASILVRLRNMRDALKAVEMVGHQDPDLRTRAEILKASISDRVRLSRSRAPRNEPLPSFPHAGSAEARAEALYYRALSLWHRDELAAAQETLGMLREKASGRVLAWAIELEAWIEERRRNHSSASRLFCECLDILDTGETRDERTKASALLGLSFIAVETLRDQYFSRISRESATLLNVESTARLRIQISYYRSVLHSLEGSIQDAFETLQQANQASVPDPFSALIPLQLAAFHRENQEPVSSSLHFQVAKAVVHRTKWAQADVEELMLLADYVIESVLQKDTSAIRAAFKLLSSKGTNDPMLALRDDPVTAAYALFARGALSISLKKTEEGINDLLRAQQLWNSQNFGYRAALAAVALYRSGNQSCISTIRAFVKRFPKSNVAKSFKAAKAQASSPFASLSAAERRVMDGICRGLTSKQIAAELGRSPATIRVQTVSIYHKLGVNTRSGLVALVANSNPSFE